MVLSKAKILRVADATLQTSNHSEDKPKTLINMSDDHNGFAMLCDLFMAFTISSNKTVNCTHESILMWAHWQAIINNS